MKNITPIKLFDIENDGLNTRVLRGNGVNMDNTALQWLLADDNPAIKYRTQTELLGRQADKSETAAWLNSFLPDDWKNRKGLRSAYFLNSFAECGLSFEDTVLDIETAVGFNDDAPFDVGCGDFMRLRALVRLGLGDEAKVMSIINKLSERQLPDGGFLCLHRLDKLKYTPKSCVKVNKLCYSALNVKRKIYIRI